MTLTHIRNSYRWSQAIPRSLQMRFGGGQDLQISLTTRNPGLAHSFATYLSETARRMFMLAELHSELNTRELGLLARNLKRLTDIVDIRDGERSRSKYFERELECLVAGRNEQLPSRRALVALQQQFAALNADFSQCIGRASATQSQDRSKKRLSEVILLFLRDCRHEWRLHTVQSRRACLRALLQILGDPTMDQITRSELAQFKDLAQQLPVRWEHMYPGVPIAEIVAKEHRGRKLRPGSVNGYLAIAHTFFEWAYIHGYIASNPARKLKIRVKDRVRDQRSRLYATDLRQIFEESLYFSRASAPSAIGARKVDPGVYHLFWIPLIALFSGMRAGEVVGLERQDICREDGVWCFRVRSNGFRDVKSRSANRSIPIHPSLIKMGLVSSITRQDFGPRQNIWPNLSKNSQNCAGAFTRIWSKYRKDSGIYDAHKTFHSFRHTFIHALADVDSHVDVVAEIAGHSMKSEFYGRYRKRPDVKRLLQTVRRVTFPCEMDHLYA